MMSPDAAGVGPQVRCFRLAGLTQEGTNIWTRYKEAEHATGVVKKFVQPPATRRWQWEAAWEAAGRRNSGQGNIAWEA